MGELVIKYHNFEDAKEEIKKFSEQIITVANFKQVDGSKGIGEVLGDLVWGRGIGFEHQVTGEELNQLTTQIQDYLRGINDLQIKLVKQFGKVYNALDALDNDYIQAILVSIKATEETSQSIQEAQEQIKNIVENQRKTLEELKKFKQKLDGYAHLHDIDKIWSDCQKWYKEINALSKSIDGATEGSTERTKKIDAVQAALTAVEKKTNDLSKEFNQLIQRLESVIAFTSALEEITHLQDVDKMWDSLSLAHDSIQNISCELALVKGVASRHQEDIKNLLAFMEKLSGLKHLLEVDAIWSRTEDHQLLLKELGNASEEHTGKLNELAQKNDSLLKTIDATKGDVKQLNEYRIKLSKMSHLEDVDGIWDTIEKQSVQLSALESQHVEIMSAVQNNKESTDMTLANAIQQSNATVEILEKKVKYAYLIAGGSAGLAIIQLIVLLMKVI